MTTPQPSPTAMKSHLDPEAPIRHLVSTHIHPGTTLPDRVRRLRRKRRRATKVAAPVRSCGCPEGNPEEFYEPQGGHHEEGSTNHE